MFAEQKRASEQHGKKKLNIEDYNVQDVISKGSFGTIYKATHKVNGKVYALKKVNLEGMNKADREEAVDEARMLAQIQHPNVVKYYGSTIDKDDRLNILMEYASKGNLFNVIYKEYKGRKMSEDLVWRYFIQTTLGLQAIHKFQIIHRDMKAQNIFIDINNNIKIGDLGIARALSNNSSVVRTLVGTPFYLSPELCNEAPYNEKTDIWALGVILYEMCCGKRPFDANNEGALIRKIMRGTYSPVEGYSISIKEMINKCLTYNFKQRPNVEQILKMPSLVKKASQLGIDLEEQSTMLSTRGTDVEHITNAVNRYSLLDTKNSQSQQYPTNQEVQDQENVKEQNVIQRNHPFYDSGSYDNMNKISQHQDQNFTNQQENHDIIQNQAQLRAPPTAQQPHPFEIREGPISRINQEMNARYQQPQYKQQAYLPHALRDNVGTLMSGPLDDTPKHARVRPELLPAAGKALYDDNMQTIQPQFRPRTQQYSQIQLNGNQNNAVQYNQYHAGAQPQPATHAAHNYPQHAQYTHYGAQNEFMANQQQHNQPNMQQGYRPATVQTHQYGKQPNQGPGQLNNAPSPQQLIWQTQEQSARFGRRRHNELMSTGPTMRSTQYNKAAPKPRGVPYAATMVSQSTTTGTFRHANTSEPTIYSART